MFDLYNSNNLEILKQLPAGSIDSVVSDPPYGWSFMGKSWDYDVPSVETWNEVMRVLKPGGHMLIACGTRTQHRMAVNIEDAGFEIRDIVAWVYGSGFPKSLNIGKAINKIDGVEFESKPAEGVGFMNNDKEDGYHPTINQLVQKGESSERAKQYEGWGTALKPAMELWTLARKPLSEKTVAENVLKWGTGGINIDGCRVETNENDLQKLNKEWDREWNSNYTDFAEKVGGNAGFDMSNAKTENKNLTGRFPANFIHDGSEEVVGMFPEKVEGKDNFQHSATTIFGKKTKDTKYNGNSKSTWGSASRFFYCAKASKSERNKGLDGFEEKTFGFSGGANGAIDRNEDYNEGQGIGLNRVQKMKNHHPTVKPVSLMKYLCRLITPKGGTVLDLYMGSGSTGIACKEEGFNFVGIELDKDYFEIAKARINNWTKQ